VWDRIGRYGTLSGGAAENIALGDRSGAEYISQLFVDDGVPSRGHRDFIIHPQVKATGMAHCTHARFGGMLVVVYAAGITPFTPAEVAQKALLKPTPTPVVTPPTPQPAKPVVAPVSSGSTRLMAGSQELQAFNEQNAIRTTPQIIK